MNRIGIKKLFLFALCVVGFLSFLPIDPVSAADYSGFCRGKHPNSVPAQQSCIAQCRMDPTPCQQEDALENNIQNVLNTIYSIVGVIAVIVIIIGAYSYVTAQGEEAKVKRGRDTIVYGIVGLLVVMLAFAITTFVLNSLAGDS